MATFTVHRPRGSESQSRPKVIPFPEPEWDPGELIHERIDLVVEAIEELADLVERLYRWQLRHDKESGPRQRKPAK